MTERSLTFRPQDQSVFLRILAIVAVSVLVNSYIFVCKTNCSNFVWSYVIVWLPVLLGYLVSVQFKKSKPNISTAQRCVAHILATVFNIVIANAVHYPEASSYFFLFTIFLFLPAQLFLILFIELILKLSRNRGKLMTSEKNIILITIGTTAVSILMVFSSAILFEKINNDAIALSGALIWLPVFASYIFSHYLFKPVDSKGVRTMERILIMLFGNFASLAFLSFNQNPSSRSTLTVLYLCLGFLAQIILILIVDTIWVNELPCSKLTRYPSEGK